MASNKDMKLVIENEIIRKAGVMCPTPSCEYELVFMHQMKFNQISGSKLNGNDRVRCRVVLDKFKTSNGKERNIYCNANWDADTYIITCPSIDKHDECCRGWSVCNKHHHAMINKTVSVEVNEVIYSKMAKEAFEEKKGAEANDWIYGSRYIRLYYNDLCNDTHTDCKDAVCERGDIFESHPPSSKSPYTPTQTKPKSVDDGKHKSTPSQYFSDSAIDHAINRASRSKPTPIDASYRFSFDGINPFQSTFDAESKSDSSGGTDGAKKKKVNIIILKTGFPQEIQDNFMDRQVSYHFMCGTISLQRDDSQLKLYNVGEGDEMRKIIIFHTDLLSKSSDKWLYGIIDAHGESIWKLVEFLTDDQITNTYKITSDELPKSSRNKESFKRALDDEPAFQDPISIRQLVASQHWESTPQRHGNQTNGHFTMLTSTWILTVCSSWLYHQLPLIPFVNSKPDEHYIEWMKITDIGIAKIGISLRHIHINDVLIGVLPTDVLPTDVCGEIGEFSGLSWWWIITGIYLDLMEVYKLLRLTGRSDRGILRIENLIDIKSIDFK